MIRETLSILSDLEALKDAFGRLAKVGPIKVVDKEKGYRISYGEIDGEEFLSPWQPFPDDGKSWVPLEVGQIVGIINPGGDPRQGFLVRSGYSDQHPAPSQDLDANVFDAANVRMTMKGGVFDLVAASGGHFR